METRLHHLPWDSSLFGYPVARVSLNKTSDEEINHLVRQIKEKQVRLTYLFCPPLPEDYHRYLLSKGFCFADEKRTYSKTTEKHLPPPIPINSYHGPATEQLIALSLQSGVFSRFASDPGFQNREYEKLYTEWIRRSVSGEIAIQTLVAESAHQPAGLITLGEKTGKPTLACWPLMNDSGEKKSALRLLEPPIPLPVKEDSNKSM